MTIKQLLEMPVDKEKSRTGGFMLTVKVARTVRTEGKMKLQWVVLSDTTGEILADINLPQTGHVIQRGPLQSKESIKIVVCWLQPGEKGPKLFVDQFIRITQTVDEYYETKESTNMDGGYSNETDWQVKLKDEIRGKCIFGYQTAMLSNGSTPRCLLEPKSKAEMLELFKFAMTGE